MLLGEFCKTVDNAMTIRVTVLGRGDSVIGSKFHSGLESYKIIKLKIFDKKNADMTVVPSIKLSLVETDCYSFRDLASALDLEEDLMYELIWQNVQVTGMAVDNDTGDLQDNYYDVVVGGVVLGAIHGHHLSGMEDW
jgi:hypothetical protein